MRGGVKVSKICKNYNLFSFTVSKLLKNKGKLMTTFDQNENNSKRLKKCATEDLDKAFQKWMKV